MKKIIALVIIFFFVWCGFAFAVNGFILGSGLFLLLAGGGVMALPALGVVETDDDFRPAYYAAGGTIAIGGLVMTIIGLAANNDRYAKAMEDSPLRFVSLGVTPKSVTIGFKKSF
jgi:hypothetical protein